MITPSLSSSTKEEYSSVKELWELCNLDALLNSFNCTIHADVKLMMIISGLMCCNSKHPCPYCNSLDMLEKGNLSTIKNITNYNSS